MYEISIRTHILVVTYIHTILISELRFLQLHKEKKIKNVGGMAIEKKV